MTSILNKPAMTPTLAASKSSGNAYTLITPSALAHKYRLPVAPPTPESINPANVVDQQDKRGLRDKRDKHSRRRRRSSSLPGIKDVVKQQTVLVASSTTPSPSRRHVLNPVPGVSNSPVRHHPHTVVSIIRSSHGIGSGVFAKKGFRPTEVIFEEKPLIKGRRGANCKELLEAARPLAQQHLLLLLTFDSNSGPNNRALEAIFRSNAIPCVEEEEDGGNADDVPCGVFKYLSRINHSCSPNSGWFWDNELRKMLLIAYREIKEGEELTTSYCDFMTLCRPRLERRESIEAAHKFRCRCNVCSLKGPESDANRKRLGELLDQWNHGIDNAISNPKSSLGLLNEALELARTEGITEALTHIHTTRFYIHAAWAETKSASLAAQSASETLARIRGWKAAKKHCVAQWADDPSIWGSWATCKPPEIPEPPRRARRLGARRQ